MLKKALLVGINAYPLRGCVNDVKVMRELLVDLYDFPVDNIRLILDHEATTKGIVEGLEWLAQGGDQPAVRVFHYAGHGHSVPDKNGDEPDGSDEALVPYDCNSQGYLIDDKLKELYSRFPANQNLTLIMDCCHSGTSQRGPEEMEVYYRFIPNTYEERQAIAAARKKFLQAQMQFVKNEMKDLRGRIRGMDEEFERQLLAAMQKFEKQRFGDHRVREGNVLLAACRSDQQAADAKINGTYHGAFTYFLVKLIRETRGKITYQELIRKAGNLLYDYAFLQEPQLECNTGREQANFLSHFVG
ncbi:MAG: caspase family protein [candidate division KSB1 bacterium]|nr:caspase family protein [candidate division KSB1 bacterium]MDZ7302391.1 caspase family protein [candidate division KSB1 bacterium]MDZ7311594.1 caspase family protein [candidate division KSB1 bacterium]